MNSRSNLFRRFQLERHHNQASSSRRAGFTLAELLIGSGLTSIALLLSGIGLSSVLSSSTVLNEENERQVELNRALNFISAEIRASQSINDPGDPIFNTFSASDEVDSASVQQILKLKIISQGTTFPVIYYVAQAKNAGDMVWDQPQMIYRWGPGFLSNGDYDLSTTENHILVDSIENNPGPFTPSDCPSGWTASPSGGSTNVGFYACISPNRRIANLFQVGRVRSSTSSSEPYRLNQQSYSRSIDWPTSMGFMPTGATPTPTPEPPIKPSPEGAVVPQSASISLTPYGGALTCGAGGVAIPTQTTVTWNIPNQDSLTEVVPTGGLVRTVPADTTLALEGTHLGAGGCTSAFTAHTQHDQGSQVLSLTDGASVPPIAPFDDQDSIAAFVANKLDESHQTVTLNANEMIFLFEVGEKASSNPSAAYDFQDIVVLAEVTPTIHEGEP